MCGQGGPVWGKWPERPCCGVWMSDCWSGSVGDRRDDRLADQVLGVVAFLVDVAGEDHDQVQVGDDLDQLAGVPSSEEAVVRSDGGGPPLVAVAVGRDRGGWLALGLGGGTHIVGRDHL